MLVDARALGFAIRKGRTSAFHLAPAIRKASAASLAADLRIYPAYIPSAWNPADPASRGKLSRVSRARRRVHSPKRDTFLDYAHSLRKSVRNLKRGGMWPRASATNDSWWSSNSSSAYGQPSCD